MNNLAIIVSSTRPQRIVGTVSEWVADTLDSHWDLTVLDLSEINLPFLDEDAPAGSGVYTKPHTLAWKAAIDAADAVLIVTPEYNGSIPGVLKNAIDWLSRPFGDGALKGKPLAVIGGSFGRYGGVWAHDETRKSFGIAGARVVESIKLSVPFKTLEGKAPAEHAELSAKVREAVAKLVSEVG